MYLRLNAPAVAIERIGADRDPEPTQRPARSLKGAKAGRLVRTLLDFAPPLGTREIAKLAGIDPGYVSRLLAMLERDDLVGREPRGPITRIDWANLLRAWTRDYSLGSSNLTTSYCSREVFRLCSTRCAGSRAKMALPTRSQARLPLLGGPRSLRRVSASST